MSTTARKASTYRAARRNAARASGDLRYWHQTSRIAAVRLLRPAWVKMSPVKSFTRAPQVREYSGAELRQIRRWHGVGRPPLL